MRKKNLAFWLLTFVALLIVSCKSSQNVPAAKSSKGTVAPGNKPVMSEEDRMNHDYLFFNANKEKITGNPDKAMELFAQCIRINGRNDAAMYELAAIYYQKKKFNDALFFARSAAELKPKNTWYQLLLADIYKRINKLSESLAIYEKLVKDYPDRVDFYFSYANELLYSGKIQEAIRVFDQVEQKIGVDRELIIQKERLFLRLGKTDQAAREIEKLIAANPSDMQAYSLLVELYQVNGMKDKVLETVERMRKAKPDSPYIFLALAEYYRSTGEKEKSFEQLKLAFASNELESEPKMRILSSYFPLVESSEEMLQQALELGKILAVTHPAEALTHAAYGDFLSVAKKFEEANIEYSISKSIDPKNENVWQQYLVNTSQMQNYEDMLAASDSAIELFPNSPVFYLFNAIAKTEKKKYEEAVKTLLAGSKQVVDNKLQLVEFYSRLGDNYHELKNHSESDKYYEMALELDPKNAFVLNNYSYYLSLRKENLDKAERMSKLSNEVVPNQASFLDTYGWILFQQSKFNDAREWLEKAMSSGGDKNGTILEHYGDVLFKLGDINRAIEFWQKARLAGDASDLLDKKIADRTYYE